MREDLLAVYGPSPLVGCGPISFQEPVEDLGGISYCFKSDVARKDRVSTMRL